MANSFIGKHGNGGTSMDFTGKMDDVRIYSRALSATEIGKIGANLDLTSVDTVAVTVNAVNHAPVRTAGSPAVISVNEESANTTAVSLGLTGLTYGVGGGSDESSQTLTYKVTAIPSSITVWLPDGTTQVAANTTLTLAQLQGLKYKTVANATGAGNITWIVQDTGGISNGGVDTLTESLSITVHAVNDQPIRATGVVGNLSVSEDSGTTSLGLANLSYAVGGGSDERSQTFTITVTAVPSPSLGQIVLADGTTMVAGNTTYTLAQLQGMQFRASADVHGGPATFAWTVLDSGGTAGGGVDALNESLTISVSATNDAPLLAGANNFTSIGADQTSNDGNTVASLISGQVGDIDSGAVNGVAVTGLASGVGTWQYSTDGGSNWIAVGSVSDTSALLLAADDRLRFVPGGPGA